MIVKGFTLAILSLALLPATPPRSAKQGGWVEVKVESSFSTAKALAKIVERGLVCEPRLYHNEFFGRKMIWAGAFLANPTAKKMRGEYHVALFDKNKRLIGSASQGLDLDPGKKDWQLGSCMVFAPENILKQVKYAQWRFYVSDVKK